MTLAIYPGSFDPITNGHIDVALRASRLFDRLVLAVYAGTEKPNALFPVEERIELARRSILASGDPAMERIEIDSFSGLTVEYARSLGATTIVRGLRAVSDFEYEFKYAHMNEHLAPEIEVVCLMTSSRLSFISSSFIREVASLGGDVHGLVPADVEASLKQRFVRPAVSSLSI
ncbi:MAG: pantetheine-phosphate adenylyltransferase [Chloroflexota bacterium]|nr:pantetheine-phosphate adenylyltransferase [Chloroflexota bacterium]